MSNKLTLLRDGVPTEIALILLFVSVVAIASVIATVAKNGPGNERSLRITTIVLCLLGLGIAGYVAYTTVILKELPQCVGGGGGCAVVENSEYSKLFGIHISVFGIIGYLSILGATIWQGDNARLVAFTLSLFGFGFSLYLKYLELFEIEAICQWCVGSAVLMVLIFIASTTRLICYYGLDDGSDVNDELNEGPEQGS